MMVDRWFIPSFLGDICLRARGKKETTIELADLTARERRALKALRRWTTEVDGVLAEPYRSTGTIVVPAAIEKVQAALSRALKPGRRLLSVVRFKNGTMEEVREAATKPEKPDAAATVAQPTVGCPAPDFERADVRATRVLKVFLTAEQAADFDRHNAFVSTGRMTGHRYMLISRHRPDVLARYREHRSLYDLDEQRALCVHDWAVPAAEELLGLHVFLSVEGGEQYLRSLPEES